MGFEWERAMGSVCSGSGKEWENGSRKENGKQSNWRCVFVVLRFVCTKKTKAVAMKMQRRRMGWWDWEVVVGGEGKQLQLDALFVRCLHITHVCPRHMCAVVERGWEGSEGWGSACVYVCVCARDVRCFCSGLFGILLLARGLCYTFLINYKLLQIYLQAGITFILPHFSAPPPLLTLLIACLFAYR